jgi:HD superfamily phosphodiesterase
MTGLPTVEECKRLWDEFMVPENIRRHCSIVSKIAVFLAEKLKDKGLDIDVVLVERASLLHDLLKIATIESFQQEDRFKSSDEKTKQGYKKLQEKFLGKTHEDAAEEVLGSSYPKLAEIIRKHGFEEILGIEKEPWTWEQKIVTYADKRVRHDKIVSLRQRFEDGRIRYRKDLNKAGEERIRKAEELHYRLEKEIFSYIGFSPEELPDRIMASSQD